MRNTDPVLDGLVPAFGAGDPVWYCQGARVDGIGSLGLLGARSVDHWERGIDLMGKFIVVDVDVGDARVRSVSVPYQVIRCER